MATIARASGGAEASLVEQRDGHGGHGGDTGSQRQLRVIQRVVHVGFGGKMHNRVGLGDICLDLHGKEQTPANMRKQLLAALRSRVESNEAAWAAVRARHRHLHRTRIRTAVSDERGSGRARGQPW